MTFDVAIVGAGIIGLTLALDLSQAGLSVVVLEKQNRADLNNLLDLSDYDRRVFAINWASQHFFESVQVWNSIQAYRVSPYQSMFVWDEAGTGQIQFQSDLILESELGHIIEQKVILKALWDQLKQVDKLQIISPCELNQITFNSSFSNIYLNSKRLQAHLIVGADGAASWVRQQAGIGVRGWSYDQSAVVATIHTEKPHAKIARQRFSFEGPLALLPLDNPHYCSIVWMVSPQKAQDLMKYTAVEFSEILTKNFGPSLGRLTLESDKRAIFPLATQQAKRYCQPGCVLVGDAAQVIHPLAGLGLNLGLQNAKVLSKLIKKQKFKQRALGDLAYLKYYERREQARASLMIAAMEGFKRGFGTDNKVVKHVRNAGLNFVNKHSYLKKCFVHFATGKYS